MKPVHFSLRSLHSYVKDIKPFHEIPGPRPLPFIGNIWRYFPLIGNYGPTTLYENALFNREQYGSIVREQITNQHTILHLFDPRDIQQLFQRDGKYPHRRSHRALLKYRRENPKLYRDGGLFPENGENWYRQRKQFQQYFTSKQVTTSINRLDRESSKVEQQLDSKGSSASLIEVSSFDQILNRWALGCTLSTTLGIDIDQLNEIDVTNLMKQLHHSLEAIDATEIRTNRWINKPAKCPYYRMLVKSQEFIYNFVSDKILKCSTAFEVPESDTLLYRCLSETKLDERDVTSFIIDILMAGLHTTSYTTAFLLYHLAKNETAQREIRLEMMRNVQNSSQLTIDDVKNLNLTKDCLREALRLNPVAIGTGRVTTSEDLIIRGYAIPNGTMVIAQTQVASRDDSYYDEPNKFKPERWAEYRKPFGHKIVPSTKITSAFATLPFGYGTRRCIGKALVELQIITLLVRLLRSYEIVSVDEIPIKTTIIHNLDGHFGVKLRKIN